MANPPVARQLVTMLRDAGVRHIYGVVGDSLNPVVDAVRHTEGIEWVHVSNEEGGAFAAAAEAQVTGQLAVCAGSCGPGNTHLLQGLYDAHRSGAPVLAIASHIQSQEIGMSFFQETHPERTFQDCSYWCEMVTPKQMPHTLRVAIQTAVGRRGVSVVVLPGDLAAEESGGPTVTSATVSAPSPPPPRPPPRAPPPPRDHRHRQRPLPRAAGARAGAGPRRRDQRRAHGHSLLRSGLRRRARRGDGA